MLLPLDSQFKHLVCTGTHLRQRQHCFIFGRDRLRTKLTFSIVDTVNLEWFSRIDNVDDEKNEFFM